MRWPQAAAVAAGIVWFSGSARAQETPADGRIVSVKLFKNGLAEGAYSVNKRNELTWTLELAPGGERRLAYRYSVLVYH